MTNYVHVYKKLYPEQRCSSGVSIKWAPLWKWEFSTCCLPGVWISAFIICNNMVIWYSTLNLCSWHNISWCLEVYGNIRSVLSQQRQQESMWPIQTVTFKHGSWKLYRVIRHSRTASCGFNPIKQPPSYCNRQWWVFICLHTVPLDQNT